MRSVTVDENPREMNGRQEPGLTLLFDRGSRPDSSAVRSLLGAIQGCGIAYDPTLAERPDHAAIPETSPLAGPQWLELVCDGLSFDLLGLGSSAPLTAPDIHFRVGLDADPLDGCDAIGLYPGPHIADGAHALPVMRTMGKIGVALARDLPGLKAVCWGPARIASSPQFFDQSVSAWLEGGPFPALCFVGFAMTDAGNLETEGLAFLAERELELDSGIARDRLGATRLAMRLIHELVGNDLPEDTYTFSAEDGTPLALVRDEVAGRFRVEPG